jgi:hypothetical protein
MVKEICTDIYKCPYCNEVYDTESEAEDCRDDCADKAEIIADQDIYFVCEYCNKKHFEKYLAINCERKHKDKEDIFYFRFEFEKNKQELIEASKVPGQNKLKTWF